jgi:hypothetical protein
MIERACDGEQAFDLILVHSYSRFFREAFEQEFYLRKLAKHGVRDAVSWQGARAGFCSNQQNRGSKRG